MKNINNKKKPYENKENMLLSVSVASKDHNRSVIG